MQGRPVLKLSQDTALNLFQLTHFQLVRCTEANVKCLVAWSNENLVVAFRGTANLTNAFADIRVWQVQLFRVYYVDIAQGFWCMIPTSVAVGCRHMPWV